MLAVAKRLSPAVAWHEGTAESLPFPEQSFNAVVSQFGLMFFPDRHKAIREMLRVLAPGGRLAVAVWDALENSPVYPLWVTLLERTAGQPAADALRAPFTLGDQKRLTVLFESAGVDGVKITTRQGTARFPSIRSMAEADLRGWLPVMGVILPEEQIQGILQEAEDVFRSHLTREGNFVFDSPAHIATGTKP
jgi:SAM-dependent methyltransferase